MPSPLTDSKGRLPEERYLAWIAWRKRIVDENFPDMCSCRIGAPPKEEFKRTDCCKSMRCGMRIKNDYVDDHNLTCKGCTHA